MDLYFDLIQKHRAEERFYPWTTEIKITMDLTAQKNSLPKEEFKALLNTISCVIENHLYDTINGDIARGIKKIKGGLYSIKVYLIEKENSIKELTEKICAITKNTQVGVSDGQDKVYTQIPAFTFTRDLEVEFWTEDYGFIFLTLTLGAQVFETRFSDVWNPTGDLKRWLEAISIGVEECSFSIQNEGEDVKFNFTNWRPDRGLFYVGWDRGQMSMVEHVNRYQFVKAMYTAYRAFLDPQTFTDKRNWSEDIADRFRSNIVEEYLLKER